jgi:hypothetical protein
MAVFDIVKNKRLAVARTYDDRREADAGDILFIRSRWMPPSAKFRIGNERHERYAHSIDSGDVRTLQ